MARDGYVEGRPLYEHCSAHALSIPERLALFLPICAAVRYAHQQLVLHRDLKPGNLPVGADGVARLLDSASARCSATTATAPRARSSRR